MNKLLVVTATAALLLTSACTDADGTVVARTHQGKWRHLVVRQDDGQTVKVRVGLLSHAWRHCHSGDDYPACAAN